MQKLKVVVLGATGMVGQRFISLLDQHPWFEVTCVAASPSSAGKTYADAVEGRWRMPANIPDAVKNLIVLAVEDDKEKIAEQVDLVFSALDMEKDQIKALEEWYAGHDVPVVSNNSAHRWTEDVPMIIPEVNGHHTDLIDIQRKNRGWNKGLIAVKSNCSIQSYVPLLHPLMEFGLREVFVTTSQAISGAGKTFESWPEMVDNVIPYIGGEEAKSEKEPMKIWATIENNSLKLAESPRISAHCIRVPVTDGHMASIRVRFQTKPNRDQILSAWSEWKQPLADLKLPSSPPEFISYFEEENRPQTKLDRDAGNGMTVTVGRLEEDSLFDWKFIGLSHNTVRGAAGGAILLAELLRAKGYLE
ncbi:MAG: aspartate-semialdehyde dehydrogenase [bacterium]|nr:aspartate-semialdehyde dehydrogenase [bacterium]